MYTSVYICIYMCIYIYSLIITILDIVAAPPAPAAHEAVVEDVLLYSCV